MSCLNTTVNGYGVRGTNKIMMTTGEGQAASVEEITKYTTLLSLMSLPGYILSIFLVDIIGPRRLQLSKTALNESSHISHMCYCIWCARMQMPLHSVSSGR